MKTRKLLKRLRDFLDRDSKRAVQELKSIREILRKLKEKEQKYTALLDNEIDPHERERLLRKRDVVHAQRNKGIERVRRLLGKEPAPGTGNAGAGGSSSPPG